MVLVKKGRRGRLVGSRGTGAEDKETNSDNRQFRERLYFSSFVFLQHFLYFDKIRTIQMAVLR